VINDLVPDAATGAPESPHDPEDVRVLPGVAAAIEMLAEAGYVLVVVSNQPAVAKEIATRDALRAVHDRLVTLLGSAAAQIAGWRYCFHHPQAVDPALRVCDCRKPAPGMLLDAGTDLDVDLGRSWLIGDADRDIEAAHAAGCRAVLIEHPGSAHRRGASAPDATAADLPSAARAVIAAEAA
jgi:D-glycero-D-manno-heptose 1,7-bisphosphate phosphatase